MKKMWKSVPVVFFVLFFCFLLSSEASAHEFFRDFPDGYSFANYSGHVTKGEYTYELDDSKLKVTDASGNVIVSVSNAYDVIAGNNDFYYSKIKIKDRDTSELEYRLYRVDLSEPDKKTKIYSGIRYENYGESIEYYYKGKIYFLETYKTESAFSILDVKTGKREGINKNNELIIFSFFEIYDSKIYFNDITGLQEAYTWGDPEKVFDMKISVYDMDSGRIRILKKIPLEDLDVSVIELMRDSVTYYYGEDRTKTKTVKFKNPLLKKKIRLKK